MASAVDSQVVLFASQLRTLLVAHEKAETQLAVIDSYISDLTQRVFRSNIDGCHGVALRLLTKKSVAAGIRKAYQQYKQRKFQSIQELSARIVQLIHPDDEPLPAPLNPVSRVSDVDEHASEVTDTFLVMSRSV